MAFVLLSRVLGVVRDMVISHRFGQDLITDDQDGGCGRGFGHLRTLACRRGPVIVSP
jgi:hypothetical protein